MCWIREHTASELSQDSEPKGCMAGCNHKTGWKHRIELCGESLSVPRKGGFPVPTAIESNPKAPNVHKSVSAECVENALNNPSRSTSSMETANVVVIEKHVVGHRAYSRVARRHSTTE